MDLTESHDWQDSKTLQECMLHMLTHQIMCDVTLKVGENQTAIKAHKYMLASRSPVFYTMFEGSLPEEGEISILDIEEDTFRTILRYFYTDEIDITSENVSDILYCAEKYMLSRVKTECSIKLKAIACSSDAAVALLTARQFHLEELNQASMYYIEKHTKDCLASKHAMNMPKECLEEILQSDFLSCSETDICKFFMKWAEGQCALLNMEINSENLRKAVGSSISLIRFPVVSKEYFATEVSHSPLLTLPEIVSIFRSYFGERNSLFLDKERLPLSKRQKFSLNRYVLTTATWARRGVEAIILRADKDIWLRGIILFNCTGTAPVTKRSFIFEVKDDNEKVIFTSPCSIDNSENGLTVSTRKIQRPFQMKKDTPYTLMMTGLDVNMYYGTGCKANIIVNGVKFKFETSPLCTTGTDIDKGQIGGITFSL